MSHPVLDCVPSIRGKVAFVTGGYSGIGRAVVEALHAHGAHVAFTYAAGLNQDAESIRFAQADPEHFSAHVLDLRSCASISESLAEAHARWGRIDFLINNAAVGSATVAAYAHDPGEQDSTMLAINADGALKMCQVFLSLMNTPQSQRPLKIVNMSSVGGGINVFPGFRASDGMSKAALAFLTRQLAAELVHAPIDVFAVCPGATNTGMFQASTLNPMATSERAAFVHALPKHRLIEPSEIANLIVFLCSAYSTPMHGAVIDASMGLGVRPGIMTERAH